jgi:hypothetical protein
MWPLFFMGLPLVMSLFANRNQPPRQEEQPRQLPPGDDLR